MRAAHLPVVLLSLATTASALPAQEMTRALVGATLIDGTGDAAVSDAVVVIRGGRIECTGSRTECAVPAGAEVTDLRGRWLIPGLVDAHVHYSQTGWADGRPDAYDARERFPYERTVARLKDPTPFFRSYLCSGVTATFDVGGFPWTWTLRDSAVGEADRPHVAAAGPLLSTRDHWLNVPAERQFIHMATDSATMAGARYLIENRTDAIKVWFLASSQMQDTVGVVRHLGIAGRMAREAGIPLIVHATNLWAAKQAARAGAKLLVHGVADAPVDEEFIRLLREAGTVYTPTLVVGDGYRQFRARDFRAEDYDLACVDPATRAKAFLTDSLAGAPPAETVARVAEAAARGRALESANTLALHRAGVPVAAGTDAGNPLTLHGPAIFLEMEALAAAGLTPMEVIAAATRNGALAMGRLDEFGTVESGKVADLVVLDADPLSDITNLRRIRAVVRAGELLPREELVWP